jgi:hypothetical protein
MIVSTALCILALGAICWMLFTLAVWALPVWLAILSGLYLDGAGFGAVAALGGGILVGAALVIAGQIAFATIRSVPLRLAIGLIYAVSAGVAGFHATAGLARLTGAAEGPALVLACLGAAIIGSTAWVRMAALAGDDVSDPA